MSSKTPPRPQYGVRKRQELDEKTGKIIADTMYSAPMDVDTSRNPHLGPIYYKRAKVNYGKVEEPQGEWEKEFDDRFTSPAPHTCISVDKNAVKFFIRRLLSQTKREAVKELTNEHMTANIPFFLKRAKTGGVEEERQRILKIVSDMELEKQENGNFESKNNFVAADLHLYAKGFNSALSEVAPRIQEDKK